MPPTILTRRELESIRNKINPPVHSDATSRRREELKKLSQDRLKHWPNTLEALRMKKLMFVEEKARKEEEARQEVDKQEAEHRRVQRLQAIERANTLMYEQTDKMKYLKGAKMYADVIKTREEQVQEKIKRKEEEKVYNARFHEHILKVVAEGDAEEIAKRKKMEDKINIIKVQRREQVDEVRAKRAAEAAEARAIGEANKKAAQMRLEADLEEQKAKQERVAASNASMVVANERQKVIRAELRAREEEAEERRAGEKEEIERRKIAMKALAERSFAKKQETRMRMIDAAIKQLSAQASQEQAIANKQAAEKRAKDDAKEAEKQRKRDELQRLIDISRRDQIQAKKDKQDAEWAEEDLMVQRQREEAAEGDRRDREKAMKEHENIARLKAIQYQDAAKAQRTKISDRLKDIQQAKILQDIGTQDDNKFAEICKEEIKKYAAQGKPVYTLLKALEQTEPTLIPARLDPTKRGAGLEKD